MSSTRVVWPSFDRLMSHWEWRPEWRPERPCLYWYLTFDTDEVCDEIDPRAVDMVRSADWLDPVPMRWVHVTLCDVGFVDELSPSVVDRVVGSVEKQVEDRRPLELVLGPVAAMRRAVVLRAGPLEPLREVQSAVRSATESGLGGRQLVHRHQFWPHLSLGYVNRDVSERDVQRLLCRMPDVAATLVVPRLSLASVTRKDRHYQWTVEAEVPLRTGATSVSRRRPPHRGGKCDYGAAGGGGTSTRHPAPLQPRT